MPDIRTEELETDGGARPTAVGGAPLPPDGLIIVEPYASWIADGRKSLLIKSKPFKISGVEFLLVTRNNALGIIKLSAPREIGVKEFKALKDEHFIDEKTRKKWWAGRKKFWAYKVVSLSLFASPIPIEPVKGPQVVIRGVKLKTSNSQSFFELAKADADALANFSAWIGVVAAKAGSWSKSVLRFVEGPSNVVEFIRAFPAKARSLASSVAVRGGQADKTAAVSIAIEEAIDWGRKAWKALDAAGQKEFGAKIKDGLALLERTDKIIDGLEDIENVPTLKIESEEISATEE